MSGSCQPVCTHDVNVMNEDPRKGVFPNLKRQAVSYEVDGNNFLFGRNSEQQHAKNSITLNALYYADSEKYKN